MIVTRFAPSPTGYLHVGGARTALFCWLMARHHNGKMILRIEDTDQKRNTPTAIKQVIDDLRWLGIDWDEGPEIGGAKGPYFQSQRIEIYNEYIKKLIDSGDAYYCFDTSEELDAIRQKAIEQKKNFTYRRPEKFPNEQDIEKARDDGKPITVRFAMPRDKTIVIDDVVRGEVRFDSNELSDFIIQKSDGFPTYNFACVIDDELMEVTHVIRGQEHLMNTPGQQSMQDALGFRRPIYVHMSVTVSETGGKLSKRERPKTLRQAIKALEDVNLEKLAEIGQISVDELQSFLKKKTAPDMPVINSIAKHLGINLPEINVVDFFNSGFLPQALVNFVALLGFSPGDDKEIMPIDELISCFDFLRLAKANSLFDRKKLLSFNTEHIRIAKPEKLFGHFKNYLKTTGSSVSSADDTVLEKLLQINAGARTLAEIEQKSRFLFIANDKIEYDEKAVKKVLMKHDGLAILQIIRDKLAAIEQLTENNIETMLRGLAEEKQLGLGKVAQPLRVAICGNTISPPIFDSVNMLGVENTLARIDSTLKKFGE